MTTEKLKIKDGYAFLIKKGIKKHEYRLNDRDFKDTQYLLLCPKNTSSVLVKVNEIEYFKTWEDAIIESDFNEIPKEDILKECNNFYSKEDIEKHGIARFEIKPIFSYN